MHSCTAPSVGHGVMQSRSCVTCLTRACRHPTARHSAAQQRRRQSSICQAEQQEPQQDEQQAEAPASGPKFLFEEDPAPAAGGDDGLLGGNAQFASVFKAALSRQPGDAAPPPPPVPEQPGEQPAQQAEDSDEIPVAPGPKFLFDEDPAPPPAEGGGDLLSANPAFASVFKASLERSRAMREGGAGSSGEAGPPVAAAAQPPAAHQEAAPAAAAAAAPAPPQQLLDPQQQGRSLPYQERQPSAAEDVLLSALRDSRRTIIALQHMHKDVEDSLKREEQQFDRLHFALQKAKSDAARMAALQQMLDRRGPLPQ